MEITLEKIELVKDRTGVTYAEAKKALEEADGSVVDAIIAIEETINAGNKGRAFGEKGEALFASLKNLVKKGNVAKIQVKREGDTVWHDSPYQFVGHTTGIYNFQVRGEEKGTEPKASFQIIGSTDIQVSPSSLSWEAEDYSAQSLDLVTGSSTSWEATVEDS